MKLVAKHGHDAPRKQRLWELCQMDPSFTIPTKCQLCESLNHLRLRKQIRVVLTGAHQQFSTISGDT
jgi:hypothetical protein